MGGVLCIDFGTSSIRAAVRLATAVPKPLAIGRVVDSSLDAASIRSEIHVHSDGKSVSFGEAALRARLEDPVPLLYETSPKLWLARPHSLDRQVVDGLDLTREDLLCGLLCLAVRSAAKAARVSAAELESMSLRVAHPVWGDAGAASASNQKLAALLGKARAFAMRQDWMTLEIDQLKRRIRKDAAPAPLEPDVLEPIAAAVELLPTDDNSIRICTIVDIGAGTTDLAIFESLVPDSVANYRSSMARLAEPVSVFMAGNHVDDALQRLLISRAPFKPKATALGELGARMRGVKETLFLNGFVQELGATVKLGELESDPASIKMASAIRSEFERLLNQSASQISYWLKRSRNTLDHVEVYMAGGGAGLEFVSRELARPVTVAGATLPVEVRIPEESATARGLGASRARLAVATGGADAEYEHLLHKRPVRIPGARSVY